MDVSFLFLLRLLLWLEPRTDLLPTVPRPPITKCQSPSPTHLRGREGAELGTATWFCLSGWCPQQIQVPTGIQVFATESAVATFYLLKFPLRFCLSPTSFFIS